MSAQDNGFNLELSRRRLLAAAGIGGGVVMAASLIGTGAAQTPPTSRRSPDPVATPPVAGLHLQFGSDASSEMVVSWHTLQAGSQSPCRARASRRQARADGRGPKRPVTPMQSPGRSSTPIMRRSVRLQADSPYLYGAMPRRRCAGVRLRSGPRRAVARRSPSPASVIRRTPTLGKKYVPPAG